MEKIEEQLKNLAIVEPSADMHRAIMRGVNYRRIRPVLIVGFCLLAINFLVIAWHINMKLVDAEFSDMMADIFADFDLSLIFFKTVLVSTFGIVPLDLFLSGLASLAGAVYVGGKIKPLEFQKTKIAY